MTLPVKIKSKGTVLAMSITSVYTPIPMIISIDKSGEKNETWESSTLDQTYSGKTKDNSGYVDAPEIGFEYFYDPTNAVHIALKTLMRTPSTTIPTGLSSPGTLFKLTYTDSGPLDEIWNVTGVGIDEKFAQNDGVKCSAKLTTSGSPSA